MRPLPIIFGALLIAAGLMALLGGALANGPADGSTADAMLVDGLLGAPGLLLAGGVALFLFGLTETRPR